jgi:hypothetical protein
MNAFISYSIDDHEQYILSLLAQKLRENDIMLVTSYNQSDSIDWQIMSDIKNATFFIGLITKTGRPKKTERVLQEFQQAKQFNKPSIMLIEDTVHVNPWIINNENTIRFDRYFPHQAIEKVNQRIKASQAQANPNAAAWILGGIGILALLSWLSEQKK